MSALQFQVYLLTMVRLEYCLKCESASRHFQPGEGPSSGLLCDCENIADDSFAALLRTLDPKCRVDQLAAQAPGYTHTL